MKVQNLEQLEVDREECQSYFKSRDVYKKVFHKMREKYASLGHFGGKIVLTKLTVEEKIQLGGFLQKDYTNNKTITISMTLLQKALEESKFSVFTWEEILEQYFGQPLLVKKEVEQSKAEQKQGFFQVIKNKYIGERGKQWFEKVIDDKNTALGYQLIQQQYKKDQEELETILKNFCYAIEHLPRFQHKVKRLPVFASQMTGNPHFFDESTMAGKLLLYFIQDYFDVDIEEIGESRPEKRNRLLYEAGILNDDLSNYVLTYGLHGIMQNGKLHEGIEGYYRLKEPLQLTLLTIQNLDKIWGNEIIYIVENPAVFSMLIESNKEISAICTNGQLRLSTMLLMDQLQEDSFFYYAGDFDPEGLLIAQNLKKRYKEKLYLWKYQKEYYDKAKSEVILSEQRLKKLQNICVDELEEIKEVLLKEKRAGYQENMVWEVEREKSKEE